MLCCDLFQSPGVYIEYTANNPDGGTTRRIPTALPIPAETIELLDLDTAVLVIAHEYLTRCGKALNELNFHPIRRLKYIGGGRVVEPGLHWSNNFTPSFTNLLSIEFCGVENVKSIGPDFVSYTSYLKSVDMSPFRSVTSVGSGFHSRCGYLVSVDLSSMSNLSHIDGRSFMFESPAVKTITWNPKLTITEPDHFLGDCQSLTAIDLTPLRDVTATGAMFLYACRSLTTIDLSPLVNLTRVDRNFLSGCMSLTTIDLAVLRNITVTPSGFLNGCTALKSVDLSPLSNVKEIGGSFLQSCTALASVDLTALRNATTIGAYVMYHCTSLTSIDLTPFGNVTAIGPYFLADCTSLTTVDLTPLVKVTATMDNTLLKKSKKAITVGKLKKFLQLIEDRRNNIISVAPPPTVPSTPVDARKKEVKAGGKKKK